jgi:hypothetical protein
VLFDSPNIHLTGGNNVEEPGYDNILSVIQPSADTYALYFTTPTSSEETNSSPSNELKEIIGTRNKIKTVTIRNSTNTSSRRTQITESNVSDQVGNFSPL